MVKEFFIPTQKNNYYPYAVRHKSLYTYVIFMLIFNFFAVHFFSLFAPKVLADNIYSSQDIISLTNKDREVNALTDVTEDKLLDAAAYAKALDMFHYNYWAHINPTTKASPWEFIIKNGFNYKYAGENLANGFTTAEEVNNAWLNSPEHKSNLLGSDYKHIGVAVVRGNLQQQDVILVVQMFGTKQSEAYVPQPGTDQQAAITSIAPSISIQTVTPIQTIKNSIPSPTLKPKILSSSSITPTLIPSLLINASPINQTLEQNKSVIQKNTSANYTPSSKKELTLKIEGVQFVNRINFSIIIFLLLIFGLDTVYYLRVRQIHARTKPLSITHLPILAIVGIICLIQSTGIIL